MTKNTEWQYIPLEGSHVWTTHDLGVSTALLCEGFVLVSIDKENPRKASFVFKKDKDLEGVVDQYFSNRLNVKARSYFDHLKALKNQLYSE